MDNGPEKSAAKQPFVSLPDIKIAEKEDAITSLRHDDIYFSREGGLAESRYVFCEGTQLAQQMAVSQQITIAETGFGTGLNLLAAQQMRDKVNPDCQIDFISFEICPLTADIIKFAHQPFAEIHPYSTELISQLPPRWPGYHKVILQAGKTHLHLHYGDAYQMMAATDFTADIWFLDGFTPAKNESLWHEDLFQEIARHSAEGAKCATFTVASRVKNGLTKAGFTIAKKPGFGRKREMLIAEKPGQMPRKTINCQPAIIGGGIAGASLAASFAARGIKSVLIDKADGLAQGASGNQVAMQSARLRLHHDAPSRMSLSCLSFASQLARHHDAVLHQGSLFLDYPEKEAVRNQKLAALGWPEDLVTRLDKDEVASLTSLPAAFGALEQKASSIISPVRLVKGLAQSASCLTNEAISSVKQGEEGLIIQLESGKVIEASHLILACGAGMPQILSQLQLPEFATQISAGQISYLGHHSSLSSVTTGLHYGGYLTPVIDGEQYLGASFDKTGQREVSEKGHQHNQSLIAHLWPEAAATLSPHNGRLSWRLSSKDRQPLIGQIAPHISIMTALGARGMTNAPLLAEMLVAQMLGLPEGLDNAVRDSLSPRRQQALR